jgi:hypothetical protein
MDRLLKTFDDMDECVKYINSIITDEKIIFIVSGRFGEEVLPNIYQSSKIVSIYVFCYDKTKHEIWSNQSKSKM